MQTSLRRQVYFVCGASCRPSFNSHVGNAIANGLLDLGLSTVAVRVALEDKERVPQDMLRQGDNFKVSYWTINTHTNADLMAKAFEKPMACVILIVPFEESGVQFAKKVLPYAVNAEHVLMINLFEGPFPGKSEFGKQLADLEKDLKNGKAPWTIIRCGFLMENFKFFSGSILKERKIKMPLFQNSELPVVSVKDISNCVIEMMHDLSRWRNKTILLAAHKTISMPAIAAMFSKTMLVDIVYETCTLDDFRALLQSSVYFTPWQIEVLIEYLVHFNNRPEKFHIKKLEFAYGSPELAEDWTKKHCKAIPKAQLGDEKKQTKSNQVLGDQEFKEEIKGKMNLNVLISGKEKKVETSAKGA